LVLVIRNCLVDLSTTIPPTIHIIPPPCIFASRFSIPNYHCCDRCSLWKCRFL